MSKIERYTHEFVEFIPDDLEPGVLYVSTPYSTAALLCMCGCGLRSLTRSRPSSSVNRRECQSHYWLDRGTDDWAARWTRERSAAGMTHVLGGSGVDRSRPHAEMRALVEPLVRKVCTWGCGPSPPVVVLRGVRLLQRRCLVLGEPDRQCRDGVIEVLGLVAPTIGQDTAGFDGTRARAICAIGRPPASAILWIASTTGLSTSRSNALATASADDRRRRPAIAAAGQSDGCA